MLEIEFDDHTHAQLSHEYLRVYSPSAEVKGHSPSQEVLQSGKKQVMICDIQPTGNYAVKLIFDDGHDTGIYTWDYLYEVSVKQSEYWQNYLARLEQAGAQRT